MGNNTVHSHEGLTGPLSWVGNMTKPNGAHPPNRTAVKMDDSMTPEDEDYDLPESSWILLNLMRSYDKRIRPNFGGKLWQTSLGTGIADACVLPWSAIINLVSDSFL